MTIQLENGYTRIANELLSVLSKLKMSGREWQLLLVIIRKTYGYNKKEDGISYSQFSKDTGLSSSAIAKLTKKMEKRGIINIKHNYCLNRYCLNKQCLNRLSLLSDPTDTKDNITKDNNILVPNGTVISKSMYNEPIIQLDENGDIVDNIPIKRTFGKYPAKIATFYCQLVGKTSASAQLKSAKELLEIAQKEFPKEPIEEWFKEIKGRIEVAKKFYRLKDIKDWNLSKVAENWDKILKEWSNIVNKHQI